jgi:DNA primase catalytic core
MARLAEDVINRIKQEVSLVRLLESQGHKLKKHGKDYVCACPFHTDDTPSLVVSPASNLWHCLGACQAGGSVIDWVMRTKGVSFRFACELLMNDLGLVADTGRGPIKQNTTTKLALSLPAAADDQAVFQYVEQHYHDTLKQSTEALAYLEKRGLHSAELIERFKLGYANRTLGYRLPEKNRKAGAEIRGQLQRLGILRESGHEHFTGSLVVPIHDENGAITEIYGRKINDNLREGTASHLYLPGPHAGVWNEAGLKNQEEVILCEALLDAMTFWVHGFTNVTASYGTAGWTSDHLHVFKKHGIQRVLIAYDRDDAGNNAAEQLAQKLIAEGFACFRVLFPNGMDANEYALKMNSPRQALELVIRKAQWLGQGAAPAILAGASPLNMKVNHAKATENTEKSRVVETIENSEKQVQNALAAPSLAADLSAAVPEKSALPASPLPVLPLSELRCQVTENEVVLEIGDRFYRVRGLSKNPGVDQLKIHLMARNENGFHTDTLELYNARQRQGFIQQASAELGVKDEVIKKDLGKVLLKLEALQEEQRQSTAQNAAPQKTLSNDEHAAALALLKDRDLLRRILDDFTRAGVVGEETNKLVGYLACVSRKLEKPLAVMIQSTSAAGKSSLMDAILSFMPEEERVQYSAMTGQSLFYMGETNLKHKILAIAEEEGAHNASYALKLLQSEGEVTIASTGKDATTGNLVTQEYRVEGPTQLFMTTTAIDLDEELLNRCLVLSVDEGREQTRAIHAAQRQKRTLAGLQSKLEKDAIQQLHRNAQRLLRPLAIINPYADQLTFLDDKTRTRRDHEKYLTLIDTIALLHQYQREIKSVCHAGNTLDYIEVTLDDIAHANALAHEVLGRTLDVLPPQTRRLLKALHGLVKDECQRQQLVPRDYRFSRKALLEKMGWTYDQVRVHLQRLIDHEYVLVHRGGRGQSFDYELLYQGEGEADQPFLMGLIDSERLKNTTTTISLGGKDIGIGVALGGHRGPSGASVGMSKNAKNTEKNSITSHEDEEEAENSTSGYASSRPSYPSDAVPTLAALSLSSAGE